MVLVAIDIIYLIVAQLLDDYSAKKSLDLETSNARDVSLSYTSQITYTSINAPPSLSLPSSSSLKENYVLTTNYYVEIRGNKEKIWKTLLYVFKALVQGIAFGLAIATRKVHIRVLNDAKEISAIIYTTTVLLLISVVGLFVLSGKYLNAFAGVFSMCLMIVCYVVLSFLFIPKVCEGGVRDEDGGGGS